MGFSSIWHWIIVLLMLGVFALASWVQIRILKKTGYSGWWFLLSFVPVLNIVMIYAFAFSTWPRDRAVAAPNAVPSGAGQQRSVKERLAELDGLRASSVISEAEYESKRADILAAL
ncbi:hypothetical protein GAY28_01620 [Azospirillum brasilense]|nr:hypothetical protein [Azospirillum brasilense]